MDYPTLNLPSCQLTTRQGDNDQEVLDEYRHRFVVLTPEEWVRQHILYLLDKIMGYPKELLQVEGTIDVNGMQRRCDIVVHRSIEGNGSRILQPAMIVECKQPSVRLTQKVIDQASRYNLTLHVPYLFLTNGMEHLCLRVNNEKQLLEQLPSFPTWQEILSGGNIEILPPEDDCCCGHNHSGRHFHDN